MCQQNLMSPQNSWWWLSKNILRQQKFDESCKWADLAKIRCASKNLLTGKCPVITQQNMLSKNLLSQQKSTDWRRDLSRSTTTYFGTTSSNVYCVCGLWLALCIWFLSCVIIPPSCLRYRFNAALLSRVYVLVVGRAVKSSSIMNGKRFCLPSKPKVGRFWDTVYI